MRKINSAFINKHKVCQLFQGSAPRPASGLNIRKKLRRVSGNPLRNFFPPGILRILSLPGGCAKSAHVQVQMCNCTNVRGFYFAHFGGNRRRRLCFPGFSRKESKTAEPADKKYQRESICFRPLPLPGPQGNREEEGRPGKSAGLFKRGKFSALL